VENRSGGRESLSFFFGKVYPYLEGRAFHTAKGELFSRNSLGGERSARTTVKDRRLIKTISQPFAEREERALVNGGGSNRLFSGEVPPTGRRGGSDSLSAKGSLKEKKGSFFFFFAGILQRD